MLAVVPDHHQSVGFVFGQTLDNSGFGESWPSCCCSSPWSRSSSAAQRPVTAASRMLFAFSRDGAVPGSRVWRKIAHNRVPVNAVSAIAVSSWALMLPTLANGAIGYLVGTSIAVIGLYIAFALPIILRIRAGSRFEHGAWSLGRHYRWVSPLALAWIAGWARCSCMPVSPKGITLAADFDWNVVNYAPLTVGAALLLFGGWYLLSARKWFTGPVPDAGIDDELRWSVDRHRRSGG